MASSKKEKNKSRAQSLVRRLESNEKLLERFESLLDLVDSDQLMTVDEIEEVLIDEIRKLGGETLESWVGRREEEVFKRLKEENKQLQLREKKSSDSTPPSAKSS